MAKTYQSTVYRGAHNGDQQGGRTTKRTAVIDKHKSEWTQNVAKDMSKYDFKSASGQCVQLT